MKVHLDCFPCFLKQAIIAVRLGTRNETLQAEILKEVLDEIKAADLSRPPAYTSTFLHRKMRQLLGEDPFKDIKSEYNQIAKGLYPELKKKVQQSDDPLITAARLAIAGNVIDFGIFTSFDIIGTIDRALNLPLSVDDSEAFRAALDAQGKVIYLLDNCGEIVFDRLLIEVLLQMGKQVRAVVKGFPVLNDSTIEDAVETGLVDICDVMDNGSDCVGTILDFVSSELKQQLRETDLVISKGQGNFETLVDLDSDLKDKKTFFLFQSKCEVVSAELGMPKGSMLLRQS
ncbi:MAG: damage-control phosphatase ARMT1 family protein [Dissulfurispiraceae bacterium]